MTDFIPTRLCCGQQHYGPVCPDGKVMCQLCFQRFEVQDLNVLADGSREDVCRQCYLEELRFEKEYLWDD